MSNDTRTNDWPRTSKLDAPGKVGAIPCTRCGGSGIFHTYGTCFRCGGQGIDPTERRWLFPADWSDELCAAFDEKRLARNDRARTTRHAREDEQRKDKRSKFLAGLDASTAARISEIDELSHEDQHYIANDILWKLRRYGSISQGQIDLLLKVQAEFEEDAEEAADAPELPELIEGRRELTGIVVSTKLKDTAYGFQSKMLVVLDDGNKVYGTIPASIEPTVWDTREEYRVTFTAAVTVSGDDEHFGWFQRPTKATAVLVGEEETG